MSTPDPQTVLDRLQGAATRNETPCGAGRMVWHAWGAGPPLVLLHGGTGSWRHWVRTIEPFADHRRVVCPDLPGLGCSDMPPDPESPPAMAAILADGLDAVIGPDGVYDLAGFSYGGVMAGVLAARDRGRVRSLTVVGSGGLGLERGPTKLVKVRHLAGEARTEAHRANLAALMFADPAKIDGLALLIQDWNTRHARLKSPPVSRGTWLRDALGGLRCQVNGIWGSLDAPSLPDVGARERAMRVLQPRLRFHAIEGAGHWVAYEAAAAFNATLRAMLD
ncbi:MAG: alpha/beta fold hydrolase [Acetobacteraceae bacterium]|nr:alpha/beta fold hydrolase [Acetobacteraceae bacterium]